MLPNGGKYDHKVLDSRECVKSLHTAGRAFVMGNEGNVLSDNERGICDEFLFIP